MHPRPPLPGPPDKFSRLLDIIVQPYDADAFHNLLNKHNLSAAYPHLVRNLRQGFPLGRMPLLSSTIIIPNHPSASDERHTTLEYLHSEISAGRMAGPFSREDMERICRGHFYASPLIVASHDEGPGLPPKLRVCRNLAKGDKLTGTPAVNEFIAKEDFPMRFDMPWKMAELVSLIPFNYFPFPFSSGGARVHHYAKASAAVLFHA